MPRYRITIEYDGTPFLGWQRQAQGPSVQGALEEALARFSGETASVRGAGRTDAGVHALGQVAHFDLSRVGEPTRVREALNFHLRPAPVAIIDCALARRRFRCALQRHWRASTATASCPAAPRRRSSANACGGCPAMLDAGAMREAAQAFCGHHDFTTFRAAQCQANSPVGRSTGWMCRATATKSSLQASARSFLHNQVRSMVGSLKLVGEGKWHPRDLAAALEARDRTACGPVAAACGLYLAHVDYGKAREAGTELAEDDD